jgi:hypothetical protein
MYAGVITFVLFRTIVKISKMVVNNATLLNTTNSIYNSKDDKFEDIMDSDKMTVD